MELVPTEGLDLDALQKGVKQYSNDYSALLEWYHIVNNIRGVSPETKCDLSNVIVLAVKHCMTTDAKRLDIEPPDQEIQAIGSADTLSRLVCQPLQNALRVTANQEGRVKISVFRRDRDSLPPSVQSFFDSPKRLSDPKVQIAELCIADHGPGIPAADIERIFHGYSSKTEGQGGWGLSFLREELPRYGGTYFVESSIADDETRGTRFSIYLPIAG